MLALHRYAAEISGASSLQEVAELTFNAVEDVLSYQYGSFLVVEDNKLVNLLTRGTDQGATFDLPLDGPGVTVKAAITGETQLVSDTRQETSYVQWRGTELRMLSELAVPVKVDGAVVAVINVESPIADAFTVVDKRFLETLGMYVGSALHRLRLIERERNYLKRLERLSKALASMNTADSIDELAELTLSLAEEVIGVPYSAFMLIESTILNTIKTRGASRLRLEDIFKR